MREIKFRGKKVDNGEWVVGLLWKKKYDTNKIFISYFPDEDDREEVDVVIPETVGQYTGLKDKNGTEIYEGDIVKITDNPYDEEIEVGETIQIGHVRFGCEFGVYPAFNIPEFECEINSFSNIFDSGEYDIEVIGNIYDNPELLEVQGGK